MISKSINGPDKEKVMQGWRDLARAILAHAVRAADLQYLVSDECLILVYALGMDEQNFLDLVDNLFLEACFGDN